VPIHRSPFRTGCTAVLGLLVAMSVHPVPAATRAVACSSPELIGAFTTAQTASGTTTIELAASCTYTLTVVDNVTTSGVAEGAGDGPNGLPTIHTHVVVNGHAATIRRSGDAGTPDFRLMSVDAATGDLTINDLTLANGKIVGPYDPVTNPDGDAHGGGAIVAETGSRLTLDDVTVTGNHSDAGGGVLSYAVPTTVTASRFQGNVARAFGGGLFSVQTSITGSTFDGNAAGSYGGGMLLSGFSGPEDQQVPSVVTGTVVTGNQAIGDGSDLFSGGGGIGLLGMPAHFVDTQVRGNVGGGTGGGGIGALVSTVLIERCLISGNTAALPTNPVAGTEYGSGGGVGAASFQQSVEDSVTIADSAIYSNTSASSGGGIGSAGDVLLTVSNTTVSDNTAALRGGGIGIANDLATLVNVTITANSAPRSGGLDIGEYLNYEGDITIGTVALANTIVGGNSGPADCYNDGGSIQSNVHSLLQVDAAGTHACEGLSGTHFALLAVDPKLSPLASNGGDHLSHLPRIGSPVIDAGDNSLLPADTANDERGPGFARILGGTVDLGAIEGTMGVDTIFRNGFEQLGVED